MYKINYLPTAKKDISDIILYISDELKAPEAALNLMESMEQSIKRLEQFPFSCRVFRPVKALEREYRILPVKNYVIFYVVDEESCIVEIQRVLYSKMDISKFIK